MYDPKLVAEYIRQAAMRRGMDPNVALQVARNEGLGEYVGDGGSSFGPYQLHYGGVAKGGNSVGGLGDIFTKRTGLDARNPDTWQAQVDFSLDEARRGGWAPWHGWKGPADAGIRGSYSGPLMGAKGVTGMTLSGPSDMAPLAYTDTPSQPSSTTPKTDPIGDLLNSMQPAAKKEDPIAGLLSSMQQQPQRQKSSMDDDFVRQMMDFHSAQHQRALQGLL
jgi:hypothetical protein